MVRKFTSLDYYRDELQQHNPSMKALIEHKGTLPTAFLFGKTNINRSLHRYSPPGHHVHWRHGIGHLYVGEWPERPQAKLLELKGVQKL
jgi:hypothetical protein